MKAILGIQLDAMKSLYSSVDGYLFVNVGIFALIAPKAINPFDGDVATSCNLVSGIALLSDALLAGN